MYSVERQNQQVGLRTGISGAEKTWARGGTRKEPSLVEEELLEGESWSVAGKMGTGGIREGLETSPRRA